MELFWAMTLPIFWPKPGNPRDGGQKGGQKGRTNGREGGEGGSRAKPGNQLVNYMTVDDSTEMKLFQFDIVII